MIKYYSVQDVNIRSTLKSGNEKGSRGCGIPASKDRSHATRYWHNDSAAPSSASFAINILNSNSRAAISHAATKVTLWLGKFYLGGTTLPSFTQNPGGTMNWEGAVKLGSPAVPVKFAGVEVVVVSRLRYRIFSWRMRPYGRVSLGLVPRGGVPATPEGLPLRPTYRELLFSNL